MAILKKAEEDALPDYDKIRLRNIRERLELFKQVNPVFEQVQLINLIKTSFRTWLKKELFEQANQNQF